MSAQHVYASRHRTTSTNEHDPKVTVAAMLDKISSFARTSNEHRRKLHKSARVYDYAATERILDVGESELGVYILASGSVELSSDANEAPYSELLKPGAIFGETGLVRPVCFVTTTAQSMQLR